MAMDWIKLISKSLGDFVLTMVLWNSLFAIMQSLYFPARRKFALRKDIDREKYVFKGN